MAGLGAKKFATNSLLSSSDVNGYLADQVIMRFATSVARDAAFGGAGEPTLAEGMTCYLDDTNVLQSYNGSAWVSVAASSTVANVSPGLVFVGTTTFAASSNAVVSNVFTSTYTNYRLVTNLHQGLTTSAMLRLQFTIGGTPTVASYLAKNLFYDTNGATVGFTGQENATTYCPVGHIGSVGFGHNGTIDVFRPNVVHNKAIKGDANGLADGAYYTGSIFSGSLNLTTAHDGFKFSCSNSATITGTVTVYGYKE